MMKLLLNNKTFEKWTEDDIKVILNDSEYSEREYIEYKSSFAFLEIQDKIKRNQKIIEYKHDICSFSNSNGGYIFFGIREEKGIPVELKGVNIPNEDIDKFELDLRNHLNGILPSIPIVSFNFIKLKNNGYIICLEINPSIFAPIVYRENENNYKFWIRRGNGKSAMSYEEIRNMFNRSFSFSSQLESFIVERKMFHQRETGLNTKFLLVEIIPDNFFNFEEHKKIYLVMRKRGNNITNKFPRFCIGDPYPNIDGAIFSEYTYTNGKKLQFFNSGCVELFLDLSKFIQLGNNTKKEELRTGAVWEIMKDFINCFFEAKQELTQSQRVYICFQILGCKDIISHYNWEDDVTCIIDRNEIKNEIIEIDDVLDLSEREQSLKRLEIEFGLSIGIKYTKLYEMQQGSN